MTHVAADYIQKMNSLNKIAVVSAFREFRPQNCQRDRHTQAYIYTNLTSLLQALAKICKMRTEGCCHWVRLQKNNGLNLLCRVGRNLQTFLGLIEFQSLRKREAFNLVTGQFAGQRSHFSLQLKTIFVEAENTATKHHSFWYVIWLWFITTSNSNTNISYVFYKNWTSSSKVASLLKWNNSRNHAHVTPFLLFSLHALPLFPEDLLSKYPLNCFTSSQATRKFRHEVHFIKQA